MKEDPYEAAHDRVERRRRELEPDLNNLEPNVGIPFGRIPRLPSRWIVIALVAFVAIGAGFVVANPNSTLPPGDCARATLTIRASQVITGYPLSWFTTGARGRYVLTVGVSQLKLDPAGRPVIAGFDKGNDTDATIEGAPFDQPDCRAAGTFRFRQGRGGQTIRLYRVDGGQPRVVATAEITSQGPVSS